MFSVFVCIFKRRVRIIIASNSGPSLFVRVITMSWLSIRLLISLVQRADNCCCLRGEEHVYKKITLKALSDPHPPTTPAAAAARPITTTSISPHHYTAAAAAIVAAAAAATTFSASRILRRRGVLEPRREQVIGPQWVFLVCRVSLIPSTRCPLLIVKEYNKTNTY